MASVINEKDLPQLESTLPKNAAATATQVPASAAEAASTPASSNPVVGTNLKGLSDTTANKLNQYGQGYQQSANVQAAQNYLNNVLNSKPTANADLSALYDKIMNREQFSYDLNGDALYQQYKDKYQNMGKQAMMDTMGNATALTGGYGSSYASTAGNQAYQQYLQQLNDIVPDLYQQAYNRYNQEGTDLMNRYNLAYGQHRDAVGDWENERNFANSDYWNQYNADYSDYQTMLNYWNQMAQHENAAYYTERDYATNMAMSIIKAGKIPTADLLAVAGISEKDAKKLAKKYGWVDPSTVSSSSGGSSSKKKSSSSSSGSSSSNSSKGEGLTYSELVSYKNNQNTREKMTGSGTYSASTMEKLISASEKAGTISSSQASTLRKNASNRR